MADQPIPVPLQDQAAQWVPILQTVYPAHTLTHIFEETNPADPDKIVLRIELTPTIASAPPTPPDPIP